MTLQSPAYVMGQLSHSAELFRRCVQSFIGGTGVVSPGDMAVTAGGGMNVNVAPGQAWVPGTLGATLGMPVNRGAQTVYGLPANLTQEGSYYCLNDDTVALGISTADPSHPRITLITILCEDADYSGFAANGCAFQVLDGIAATSPVAPVPSANSLVIASIVVPAGATSITIGDITNVAPRVGPVVSLVERTTVAAATAAPGDLIEAATGGYTITLPLGPPANSQVQIWASVGVSGTSPVEVAASGSSGIYGLGANDLPSITLGTLGAFVHLQYDGVNWIIRGGQIDTGWKPLTLASGVAAAGGAYTPSARLQGDRVWLKGAIYLGSAVSGGATIATLPAGMTPSETVLLGYLMTGGASGNGNGAFQITPSGALAPSFNTNAADVPLDGLSFSLS